jgi:hypothetical protein
MRIELLRELYEREVKPICGAPQGCKLQEIAAVEHALGASLAPVHRDFLLWMGKDHKGLLHGTRVFVDDLLLNLAVLYELFETNGLAFPKDRRVCVFFTHQGYQATWYELPSLSSDPECFFLNECAEPPAIQHQSSFSEFMKDQLSGAAQALRHFKER